MERYDAILEQLEKAQGRGMETITNRLDFVVQSLEELIQEAKSSIQKALPESANECLPVDGVKTAIDALRDESAAEQRRNAELETRVAELERTTESSQHGASIALLRALDGASSQSELLKELLPAISEHAARAVVLVLREGKVTAWSGIGFADGEVLRSWQGDAIESPALATLLEVSRPVRFAPSDDDLFRAWLADETYPIEVILIPVVLRGKLMGTVYVDRLEGQPWHPETAQSLVAQVCWLIDTLQYRRAAAASLAEPVEIGSTVEVFAPEAPPVDETPQSQDEIDSPVTLDEEPVPESEVEAEPAADTTEIVDEAPDEPEEDHDLGPIEVDPSATMKIDVSEMGYGVTPSEEAVVDESFEAIEDTEPEPEPEIVSQSFEPDAPAPPEFDATPEAEFEPEPDPSFQDIAEDGSSGAEAETAPVETEAETVPPEPAEIPTAVEPPVAPDDVEEAKASQFLDEPPPVQPVQPPPAEPEEEISEDEAQREEARRFARLLVSEIKLYNEEQVERGRETKDLYHRLQEDINRSREMFEKRIAPEVRADQDYFQDELVRILADGDPEALGM